MDGDHAPLREIVELKEKFGAWLMVDEAHATGLYGVNRRGLAEALGVQAQIEIQMGTLGKALGASPTDRTGLPLYLVALHAVNGLAVLAVAVAGLRAARRSTAAPVAEPDPGPRRAGVR